MSIEQLADQVAEFKLPQHGTGKGVYELKPGGMQTGEEGAGGGGSW